MTPVAKALLVQTLAREVGFDLIGVAQAAPLPRATYYKGWLAAGRAGTMTYLERNVPIRLDPSRLLPGARSVICVALNYRRADGYLGRPRAIAELASPPAASPQNPTGRVAQYARGRDYHVVMRRMLSDLIARLRERLRKPFDARIFVDCGPIVERELAAAAGLGWIGKNTCLINPRLGSYLLLGEAVTTLDLNPGHPIADGCGSCARCLRACPASALTEPYRLDARRCVSYLTLEHRGPIASELHALIGDRVFGCDVCQQVCPYNAHAPLGTHPDLLADVVPQDLDLLTLLNLTPTDHKHLTGGSAAARATRSMWRRNAAIALGNVARPTPQILMALETAAGDEDPVVRDAALESLRRLARKQHTVPED